MSSCLTNRQIIWTLPMSSGLVIIFIVTPRLRLWSCLTTQAFWMRSVQTLSITNRRSLSPIVAIWRLLSRSSQKQRVTIPYLHLKFNSSFPLPGSWLASSPAREAFSGWPMPHLLIHQQRSRHCLMSHALCRSLHEWRSLEPTALESQLLSRFSLAKWSHNKAKSKSTQICV